MKFHQNFWVNLPDFPDFFTTLTLGFAWPQCGWNPSVKKNLLPNGGLFNDNLPMVKNLLKTPPSFIKAKIYPFFVSVLHGPYSSQSSTYHFSGPGAVGSRHSS